MILLLERATQDLYRGEVAEPDQHHPLHLFRRRVLGGTSSVWGGRCVPLDDIDFQRRDYVPHSGWPITKSDLDPFYARANGLCEAGAFAYEADDRLPSGRMEMIEGFDGEDVVSRRLERWSVPTDFGKRYLPTLKRSGSTRLVLHANCTAIQLDEQGRSVAHVTVSTIAGHSFRVRARYYVLAAGGLVINPRFVIPANDGNAEVKATQLLAKDTLVTSFTPHMHVRGKDMIYIAHYPDGTSETLLSVPKYDFNWQITYQLATPKVLPKGTEVEVIAHFDNSPGNKFNPDPSKDVKWGDQTFEEMMFTGLTLSGSTLTVASVINASVPSLPTSNFARSNSPLASTSSSR